MYVLEDIVTILATNGLASLQVEQCKKLRSLKHSVRAT